MADESRQGSPFQNNNNISKNPLKGTSNYMEVAAMVCGIASIVCCVCIYLSLIFGALAILLGLLSRGGERKMKDKAVVGVALGGTGLGFTVLIYSVCIVLLVSAYGGVGSFLESYSEMSDMTTQELYNDIYEHIQEEITP